jgi:hypothetical protein
MQPLPLTIPESQNTPSHILSAYSKILRLEKAPDYSRSKHEFREDKLIRARILGYLIREGPSTQAKDRVAQEVNSCRNDDEMDKLGEMYYAHYIRPRESPSLLMTLMTVRKNKGGTPAPSSHPSRRSFETKCDMIRTMLCEPSRSLSDAKRNVRATFTYSRLPPF